MKLFQAFNANGKSVGFFQCEDWSLVRDWCEECGLGLVTVHELTPKVVSREGLVKLREAKAELAASESKVAAIKEL